MSSARGAAAGPSARHTELLEASYAFVLEHGLADLSLRPLAAAVGSSPRVLLYLFGSKENLIKALLTRARADELRRLEALQLDPEFSQGLTAAAARVWTWLSTPAHRPLLTLWVEAYARSVLEPEGAWSQFAQTTVDDWMALLARSQPRSKRNTRAAATDRTLVLATLRGALLDLLATDDLPRVNAAVRRQLTLIDTAEQSSSPGDTGTRRKPRPGV